VDDVTALYQELDPLRPLGGEEDGLYVDWQRQLDPEGPDVKSRLVQAFRRNATPERPITRLLTGHRGSGKTTELNRVRSRLAAGDHGPKVFSSMLFAQEWLDLEDVQPEDLVLQIVRQLVADLREEGVSVGEERLKGFFSSLWARVRSAKLDTVEAGIDPLSFSFTLEDFPTARSEFRSILRAQLPTVFDLVNTELLPAAREHLAGQGYDDLLLVVDDLDKIPQKVLREAGLTNHENLFLDNSAALRAINCSLLLTIPIELAYSPAQARLRDDYGASIHTVPLLSIIDRGGSPIAAGRNALIEIMGRRAQRAFGAEDAHPAQCAARIFESDEVLRRVVALSGGHLRSLLVIASELLDWVEELPVGGGAVERYAARTASDLGRALFKADKDILEQVAGDGQGIEDPRFFELLRNQYVFAYEAGADGHWYGINPFLREIDW
jgi:hypothetical protein